MVPTTTSGESMAKLIPTRSSCLARMTPGERRFSERLQVKLEDDYLLWYDIPIGPKQQRPDFTILHPRRGLLVLEVKDWKEDTIREADRMQFALLTARGLVREPNPLAKARVYVQEITRVLECDPALRHGPDSPHAGKLIMPWAHGVVFTNLTRKRFEAGGLDQIIPPHLAICQDEMLESIDPEAFQQRLWAMFAHAFPIALTLPQLDRVRWHLFPEIRVEAGSGQFGLFADASSPALAPAIPDLVKVMDAQQEQLARSLGDEHRVIHGVAGSGKTMILGFRALHLARALTKPILVLCFNRTLAARLQHLLAERGLAEQVQVYNFHRWCRAMLGAYHVPLPAGGAGFIDALVPAVMAAVERGQIPRHHYGAVLIDEGHDFEPDWYRLVVQMIDPTTNSLLVLYDDAQNIYGKGTRRKVSWKSLGVQAQGRTTILKLNYRNTLEILAVARQFAAELLQERPSDDDGVPLLAPESAGRRGPLPELIRTASRRAETTAVVERVVQAHARGRAWREIAIVQRDRWQAEALQRVLAAANVPCNVANDRGGKDTLFGSDAVRLVTMHSSKGLEFPLVLIAGLDRLPARDEDEASAARLLYVAMTRATEELVLLHHADTVFSQRLRQSIDAVQAQLALAA